MGPNTNMSGLLDQLMSVVKRLDREELYDHIRVPAVIPGQLFTFFESAQNGGLSAFAGTGTKTEVDTNLQLPGELQDGEWFICDRMSFTFPPRQGVAPIVAGPVTFSDVDLLQQDIRFFMGAVGGRGAHIRIKLGGEQLFWQDPAYTIGSGVNPTGVGHNAAYDTYNLTTMGAFMLSPGVRFKVQVSLVNTGNFPSANPVVMGWFFHGFMIRPADYGAVAQDQITQLLLQMQGQPTRRPMAA